MSKIDDLKVGDGVTACFYTDRTSCTIIEKTDKRVKAQVDDSKIDPDFKPEIIPGGFAGHCVNNNEQKWISKPDKEGYIYTFTKRKNDRWVKAKDNMKSGIYAIPGRHHFRDYNF